MRRVVTIVPVLALLLLAAPAARGSVQTDWHRTVAASVTDVAVGSDGAVYVVGHGPPDTPFYDGYASITRYTTGGALVWTRTWQFHPERPQAFSANAVAVAVADNGVVYVTGTVQRYNCEGGGWFVRAYGPSGRLLDAYGTVHRWTCHIGPQGVDDIAVDGALVLVAVRDYGCCGEAGLVDGSIWAFDRNLDRQWRVDFEPPAPADLTWWDEAQTISIGAGGEIYASGWAAIEPVVYGERDPNGSLLVMRLSRTGAVAWSLRPGVPMGRGGAVASTPATDGMVVAAAAGRGGIWLGRMRVDGSASWAWTWGADPKVRARPGGLDIDATGRIWLAGSRRDLGDSGANPFVMLVSPAGKPMTGSVLDAPARSVLATGVATLGRAGFVVATEWNGYRMHAGHVWRLHA